MRDQWVFDPAGRTATLYYKMWGLNKWFWLNLDEESPKAMSNLCQWFRVVVLWPVVHVALIIGSAIILAQAINGYLEAAVDPVVANEFWQRATVTVMWVGGIALVIYCIVMIRRWLKNQPTTSSHRAITSTAGSASKEPGLWAMLWTWLIARKERICPVFVFAETVDGEIITDGETIE